MNKLLDDIVIIVTVALGLLIALYLSWSLVVNGAEYPPTLISAFLGIAIAALTFRFLGGAAGTEFSVGVLKLGGSAALLLGTTLVVGDRLRDEINLFASTDLYREQMKGLKKQLADADEVIVQRGKEVETLRAQLVTAPSARGLYNIDEIMKMKPDNPFIRELKQRVYGKLGPFRETIRELSVPISVVRMRRAGKLYNICEETFEQLYEGSVPNSRIRLARSVGEEAVEVAVEAERSGRIDQNECNKPDNDFKVQISCEIAEELFADLISSCVEGQKVRGKHVNIGALPT